MYLPFKNLKKNTKKCQMWSEREIKRTNDVFEGENAIQVSRG